MKKASIYTHYRGGQRDEGIDEGATLILHTENRDSWFWYIPLPDDKVSVGVVGAISYLVQGRREDAQTIFDQELAKCRPMQERLQNAEQLFPVKTTKDFSYRASRIAGEGWVLVGDAFCFLDPMYSSGVYLALKSGEMAADAIAEAFAKEDFSAAQLGGFGPELVRGMEAVRKMVYAFLLQGLQLRRIPQAPSRMQTGGHRRPQRQPLQRARRAYFRADERGLPDARGRPLNPTTFRSNTSEYHRPSGSSTWGL